MKALVIGANRRVGVSEKSGKPYDIAEVSYLVLEKSSVKVVDGKQIWEYTGKGMKVQTMPCAAAVLDYEFSGKPELLDMAVEPQPDYPQKNWVVGLGK